MIVSNRCAIVITVQWENFVWIVVCIKRSVSKSTHAVASSKTRIFERRNKARAKQTNWRWPTLKWCIHVSERISYAYHTLSLPHISASIFYYGAQSIGHLHDVLLQMAIFQRRPNLLVGIVLEWIHILPQRSVEQGGILRNHGHHSTKFVQTDGRHVHWIDDNRSRSWFDQSE